MATLLNPLIIAEYGTEPAFVRSNPATWIVDVDFFVIPDCCSKQSKRTLTVLIYAPTRFRRGGQFQRAPGRNINLPI